MTSEPVSASGPDEVESTPNQPEVSHQQPEFVASFFHGTRADLKTGDLIVPGHSSNYGERKEANFVYLSANLSAATWGAELAVGDGPERIYVVEPTGTLEDDPNLTDKKFPGNPTRSYRTREPVRVVGEVTNWQGHTPESVRTMKDGIAQAAELGIQHIDD